MHGFINKILKIYQSIIIFNSIFMMDSFCKRKISPKMFFHHKTTSLYISSHSTKRMFRFINPYITSVFKFSAFPCRAIRTMKIFSKIRIIFSFQCFVPIFRMNMSFLKCHNFLQRKRASLGVAYKKWLNFLTPTQSPILTIKNPLPVSNNNISQNFIFVNLIVGNA